MPKIWLQEKAEIEEVLKEMEYGFLGLSDNGKPYVIPISYAYQDNKIYLHTGLKGLKMEYLKNNPQVCFTAAEQQKLLPGQDPCSTYICYRSVIASGQATILEEPAEKLAALQIIAAKYLPDHPNSYIDPRKIGITAVIVIEIDEMSGKCYAER